MEKGWSIDLPVDDNEMLPRQCPNCEQAFLIHLPRYTEGMYLNLRCPYCEWVADSDEFVTDDQAEYAAVVGENELRNMAEDTLNDALDDIFGELNSSKHFSVNRGSSRVDFGRHSLPSPIADYQIDKSDCNNCGFSYSTLPNSDPVCPVCR